MSYALLGDVVQFIRGVTFKPEDLVEPGTVDSVVVMRTKNIQSSLDDRDLIAVPVRFIRRKEQFLREGDILLSSANSWELVGKSCIVPPLEYVATAGGFISIVRSNENLLDARYFYHWITSGETQHKVRHCGRQTTNISNLDVGRFLELEIPLPPLAEQKRIAAILDKADALRRKRQQAIELADQFLRSVFLDMFGDPVTNPKGWPLESLTDFGQFKNGLNYSKSESGHNVYCIGVGDFKAFDRLVGVDALSSIQLDELPDEGYLLEDGDLLFVRSNGNKALVGRCLTVHPNENNVTFSGFCIRYRPADRDQLNSDYLNYCMRMPSMKNAMLKGGQGANIQNISQKTLSSLLIPLPPAELQRKFAHVVQNFRAAQEKAHKAFEKGNDLFNSLSQQAFAGTP
ncbi:restriction endonuclease subunit S [Plesiomonas shigelloides]|uniref:restriction endonuclease subunit S n=1 Tax=Plesiomonas shigelloides TaxID=703 RepID=UPI00387F02D2